MTQAVYINTANKRNLLQIIQDACNEMAIDVPSSIVGNNNAQVRQLLALANREGQEISEMANGNGGWQELRKQHTFNTEGIGPLTGNITDGSAIITNISDTSELVVGYTVTGTGVPLSAEILTIDSASQITMNVEATATLEDNTFSFGKQAYDLPEDLNYFIEATFWDRSYRWQILLVSAQEWQIFKSGIAPIGPRKRFRIMENKFYLDPVPVSTDVIAFEYYSTGWCQSSSGVAQSRFARDTDYFSLDDNCLVLGIMRSFLASKGLYSASDTIERKYKLKLQRLLSRNGANQELRLNREHFDFRLLSNQNIPDTGYGV